jgi:hypothetical protein
LKIHLNIILPSTPGSLRWFLSLRFPHQNPIVMTSKTRHPKVFHSLYFPPIFVPVCPFDPNVTQYEVQLTPFQRFLTCVCTLRCLNCYCSSFSNNSGRLLEL